MDRPRRFKRRDPQRTAPRRHAGEAWRDGEPWRDSVPPDGDAASRGVREGYRVIEEQIRRGRRMAQEIDEEDRNEGPHDRERRRRRPRSRAEDGYRQGADGFRFLEAQMRRTQRLVQEILRQVSSARPNPARMAELILRLYVESVSDFVLLGFDSLGALTPRFEDRFDEDTERIGRDTEESFDDIDHGNDYGTEDEFEEEIEDELSGEPWDWPPAPSAPAVIRTTVPIPVYVSSSERTEIDLDLPAGAQSLELVIEPPLASGVDHPVRPAFEAELFALADGPSILRIAVPRDLPAGRYQRRVLIYATGEPVGTLTVQLGAVPVVEHP